MNDQILEAVPVPPMRTIKQPIGSAMCTVCVAAMITNTEPEDVYAFLNDGRDYGAPIHDPELAAYLLKHGWSIGRGFNFDKPTTVKTAENVKLFIDGIQGQRAYLAVVSKNFEETTHAVYWDGYNILDPDSRLPETTDIADYELLTIWPLNYVGFDYTLNRICFSPATEPPPFARDWKTTIANKVPLSTQ